jgi:class 3 adenylate cyclase/pimeloyl-ACP methyl ester carboxylesterase
MSGYRFPRVRYAAADGVRIAYEVRGDGPIDIVRVPGSLSGVVAKYLDPIAEAYADRLASFARLIDLDRRGTGLSDPLVVGALPPLEQRVADVLAVMDAVGSRSAVLVGAADGGQVAILCAAMHPSRVDALYLPNAWARLYRSEGYPYGLDPAVAGMAAQRCKDEWGNLDRPWGMPLSPSRRDEPGFSEVLARVEQVSASPSVAATLNLNDGDVTDVLSLVQARTLVTYARDARRNIPSHARFLAEHIPHADLVGYPGGDIYFGHTAVDERAAVFEEFITGSRPTPLSDRVLATVLFTDIVSSTFRVAELGDERWRKELDRHDTLVRDYLDQFRGREVSTAGDSFFATFDGPARAIRCAQAIVDAAQTVGLDVRAGIHTGECEVRGGDLGGIAVHIGARVAALAHAGQVLTTSTVKDLVAGSGITFADHGVHELKGIPEPWHLYEIS